MKIPKTMGYGRTHITVEQPKLAGRGRHRGNTEPHMRLLRVARYTLRDKRLSRRAPNERSETLWHELTHMILHDMNHPLWRTESFVNEFAKRLNSAIIHAKF